MGISVVAIASALRSPTAFSCDAVRVVSGRTLEATWTLEPRMGRHPAAPYAPKAPPPTASRSPSRERTLVHTNAELSGRGGKPERDRRLVRAWRTLTSETSAMSGSTSPGGGACVRAAA